MTPLKLLAAALIAGCAVDKGTPSTGGDIAPDGSDSASTDEDGIPECKRDGDVLDLRREFPAAPEGGIEIRAPHIEVPPFSQAFYCYWGTYTGPDVGVTYFAPLQSEGYDHHNILREVVGPGSEDGVMEICPTSGDMYDFAPLIEATGIEPAHSIQLAFEHRQAE